MPGTMEIIVNQNTTIEKQQQIITSLELSIKEDLKINDTKSLKYHSMALVEHRKMLLELEKESEIKLTI
ncbi:MAG: hypothetical protein RR847_05640 [Bacilli bacterium]